jgi:hypothetical protein
MNTNTRRHLLATLVALSSISMIASCSDLQPGQPASGSADFVTIDQAIYYGTRDPQVTDLSDGQIQAIGFLADSSGSVICTATLIDRDVAVTARHCVEDTLAIEDMRFGMGDPSNPDALIAVHSAPYNDTLDTALLFLMEDAVDLVPGTEPLDFNRVEPNSSLIGTNVEQAGYGQTDDDSDGLYFAALELENIESEHLVVNGRGQRGICFGDSGGPLFIPTETGEYVIGAVESYGDATCVDQDFETRLDLVSNWIDDEMANFDPNSEPTTGTQGDGSGTGTGTDEICIPTGILGVGQNGKTCPEGTVALCSVSPTVQMPHIWVAILLVGSMIVTLRRRR